MARPPADDAAGAGRAQGGRRRLSAVRRGRAASRRCRSRPRSEPRDGRWGAAADRVCSRASASRSATRCTVGEASYRTPRAIEREPDHGARLRPRPAADDGRWQPRRDRPGAAGQPRLPLLSHQAAAGRRGRRWRRRSSDSFPTPAGASASSTMPPRTRNFLERTALYLTLVGLARCSSAGSASPTRCAAISRARRRPSRC